MHSFSFDWASALCAISCSWLTNVLHLKFLRGSISNCSHLMILYMFSLIFRNRVNFGLRREFLFRRLSGEIVLEASWFTRLLYIYWCCSCSILKHFLLCSFLALQIQEDFLSLYRFRNIFNIKFWEYLWVFEQEFINEIIERNLQKLLWERSRKFRKVFTLSFRENVRLILMNS